MAEVERILASAAQRSAGATHVQDGKAVVERAVWLCPCITFDETPVWLICDDPNGKLAWSRMSHGVEIADLVDALVVTGAHVSPEQVLSWLRERSTTTDDWPFDGSVIEDLGRKIRELNAS